MKVNILGIDYEIKIKKRKDDVDLATNDGYCDKTSKEIVIVAVNSTNSNLANPEWYYRKVLRHEIVHAFLIESGLQEAVEWDEELLVDYFACQGEKIYKAWKSVGAIV